MRSLGDGMQMNLFGPGCAKVPKEEESARKPFISTGANRLPIYQHPTSSLLSRVHKNIGVHSDPRSMSI